MRTSGARREPRARRGVLEIERENLLDESVTGVARLTVGNALFGFVVLP